MEPFELFSMRLCLCESRSVCEANPFVGPFFSRLEVLTDKAGKKIRPVG